MKTAPALVGSQSQCGPISFTLDTKTAHANFCQI